jgi:hypothetical protein
MRSEPKRMRSERKRMRSEPKSLRSEPKSLRSELITDLKIRLIDFVKLKYRNYFIFIYHKGHKDCTKSFV